MTVNYTTLLSLGQPVTGTEVGTWGDDVNNAVTSYLDIAIAGTLTLTGDGPVTLANTQGTNSATNIGATTAQYYALKIVGPLSATKVITAPSASKGYVVINTDSTYGVTVKASGQSGVTVAAGTRALVSFNGTDYVLVSSSTVAALDGLGTGVAAALATNVGSPGAVVVNGGALGTPSSGTVTNLTGTANININGTVGATTPNTGAFTSVVTPVVQGASNFPYGYTSYSTTAVISAVENVSDTLAILNLNSSGSASMWGDVSSTIGAGNYTSLLVVKNNLRVGVNDTSPDTTFTVNGNASFGNGSVTTPSVAHRGDLNTGFWFPAADTIAASTAGVERLRITSDGRLYGTALHNNAGSVTGTTNQYIASGTGTPVVTGVANVASSSGSVFRWMRVGNVVTVSGYVSITPTTDTITTFRIALPIASNFASAEDLSGTATGVFSTTFIPCSCFGDSVNDEAIFSFNAPIASATSFRYTYTYVIL